MWFVTDMSAKKSQRVNSSPSTKRCRDIINQINQLASLIRSGDATQTDVSVCMSLTNKLIKFINKSKDIDDFYKWVANETIEMSTNICKIYDRTSIDDKI
jgi:hypothetical protein